MATPSVSRAIKLFGTSVPEAKSRRLTAGPLSVELDNGALRYVRLGEVEVLRAIAFLVRDENWGTYAPSIDKLVVRQGAALTAIGTVAGVLLAAAATRYLEGMLFGLTPLDPSTFIVVVVTFAAVATLAAYVPARRATRVDPVVALRGE